MGHVDYLKALVEIEIESRYHKRIKSLLKKSKIPRAKDIKDFDVNRIPDLTQGTIKDLVTHLTQEMNFSNYLVLKKQLD